MSDVFEGPGYWMASDGKWYAPERHPDPGYRARFAGGPVEPTVQAADATDDSRSHDLPDDDSVPSQGEFPSVGLNQGSTHTTPPSTTPLSDIHRTVSDLEDTSAAPDETDLEQTGDDEATPVVTAEVSQPFDAPTDLADDSDNDVSVAEAMNDNEEHAPARSFSVGVPSVSELPERPVFEMTPPASVGPPPSARVENPSGNRVELEISKDAAIDSPRASPSVSGPKIAPAPSTSLAVIPQPMGELLPATNADRIIAAAIFISGVAMIVGTFLEWTTGSLVQTGWDRGDGIATIIAGIVGSAAAGPIYVGYRHIIPKSVAIVAGLVGLVVIGLTAIGVLFDSSSANTSIGLGFIVVFVASTVMAIAGLADRGEVLT